jgi:MFS family permease
MIIGQAIAGVGFGASFTASLRLIFPLAAAHQRAGVVAGIYLVSYIAFGVPIVIAGQLAGALGEVSTVTWYSALTVLLALVSLIAQIRIERNPRSGIELARGSDPRTSGESMAERDHPLPVSATPNTPIR